MSPTPSAVQPETRIDAGFVEPRRGNPWETPAVEEALTPVEHPKKRKLLQALILGAILFPCSGFSSKKRAWGTLPAQACSMNKSGGFVDQPHVYLAGPDVFRTDSRAHGARLVEICARHGLVGLYPADDKLLRTIAAMRDRPRHEVAEMVFRADVAKIHLCHGVIANLEPFRSPSADPGTTWEMGMAYGQGKPVFAYCADRRTPLEKTLAWNGKPVRIEDGLTLARDGMTIDALDEIDNLMMTRSVVGPEIHPDFETAVIAAARYFRVGRDRPTDPCSSGQTAQPVDE